MRFAAAAAVFLSLSTALAGPVLVKVSEIDRLRQFTTKYTLADAVQRIVAIAQESHP